MAFLRSSSSLVRHDLAETGVPSMASADYDFVTMVCKESEGEEGKGSC